MKFPITVPCKIPRIKIQVWDQDLLNPDDAICEANLNLRTLYSKLFKRNTPRESIEKQWLQMTHPKFNGVQGEVLASIEILTQEEANATPAGLGRGEPNTNPHLEEPKRPEDSLAPWAIDKKNEISCKGFEEEVWFIFWKFEIQIGNCLLYYCSHIGHYCRCQSFGLFLNKL